MHAKFCDGTGNVKRFLGGIRKVEDRGSAEACWLAAIGEPGNGKSRTLMWYATQKKGVYIRAKAGWNTSWMLSEIIAVLMGSEASGSNQQKFLVALRELARRGCPLIIDEAWNMLGDARLLETLRDFSDTLENLIIIGGENRVTDRLKARYPQIASRITATADFKLATSGDVRTLCDTLCEVTIADDLVTRILSDSGGYTREIKNCIATCEKVGKRNGKTVTAKDMEGQELCADRRGGLPEPLR